MAKKATKKKSSIQKYYIAIGIYNDGSKYTVSWVAGGMGTTKKEAINSIEENTYVDLSTVKVIEVVLPKPKREVVNVPVIKVCA